jgi:hypothetical protein
VERSLTVPEDSFIGTETLFQAWGLAGGRGFIGLAFSALAVADWASDFALPIGFSFSVLKFPSSQQATKVSVTDFSSSHRARICCDSALVI